jgi:ribosomal subunit interface protein
MSGLRTRTRHARRDRYALLCCHDRGWTCARLRLSALSTYACGTCGHGWTILEETIVRSEVAIVLTGRNVEAPDLYRTHVIDRLTRVERYDRHIIRYEVELTHEPNPRQSKNCQHVTIIGRTAGRTLRAKASGPDFHTAINAAVGKLEERLRRTDDRRHVRHDRHQDPATDAIPG